MVSKYAISNNLNLDYINKMDYSINTLNWSTNFLFHSYLEKIEFTKSFWFLKQEKYDSIIQWLPQEILEDIFTLIIPNYQEWNNYINHKDHLFFRKYLDFSPNVYNRSHDCFNYYDTEVTEKYLQQLGLSETIETLTLGMNDEWMKDILVKYIKSFYKS